MKNKDLTLWGTKKGEKYESLIAETDTMENIAKATLWAKENGYEKLRFWKYTGETPDFVGTITK